MGRGAAAGASGTERGKPAVSVMYAECLHVLDDSDTSACHRRHQFYLVTALPGNPYDCSAVRTLLIVIYLSGVIMLSGERQSGGGKMEEVQKRVGEQWWSPGLWLETLAILPRISSPTLLLFTLCG